MVSELWHGVRSSKRPAGLADNTDFSAFRSFASMSFCPSMAANPTPRTALPKDLRPYLARLRSHTLCTRVSS
jgi:hypothetical protein